MSDMAFVRREAAREFETMKAAASIALVGATVFIGSAVAQQQQLAGPGQFCIKGPTGPVKCEYQTMAQCEQARPQNENDRCVSRSQAEGTVGGPAAATQREPAPTPGEQKD
jgi:hypothetical protein